MLSELPLFAAKAYDAPSVFRPENLLREARRQKGLVAAPVPSICVLDPDGDLVAGLQASGRARRGAGWACYHTELHETACAGGVIGVIGRAVGAPFAVLVAEQLFASGCRLLMSITSAGELQRLAPSPYFVLIDRALRDEGTSQHYMPPTPFAEADPVLAALAMRALAGQAVQRGTTWTTDAPFRETEAAIAAAKTQGAIAVEMEAAALYAFASARGCPVICFAHVTNQLAQREGDFEKGAANGAHDALRLVDAVARAWNNAP